MFNDDDYVFNLRSYVLGLGNITVGKVAHMEGRFVFNWRNALQ